MSNPDHDEINALCEDEQVKAREMLTEIEESYRKQRLFYTGDRLRTVIGRH
jgi:hypothetical protein